MVDKQLKEDFVSNLNGTSLVEIALGSLLAPLCVVSRGLIIILCFLGGQALPLSKKAHFLVDFMLIVIPLVMSCTLLSDMLLMVILSFLVISLSLFLQVYNKRRYFLQDRCLHILKVFLGANLDSKVIPSVTAFRVLVNMKTAISILAVDFAVFPRRYAKTESYGTGVMDFGVGAFVLANSLVSPESRQNNISKSKLCHVIKQLLSVWPLAALGMGRIISLKFVDYHEHVSEYGVHWNFFFTLAIVRVVASSLLTFVPAQKSWIFACIIGVFYQTILETTGLKSYILQGSDREEGFISANREGLFSIFGYITIYLAGVQIGLYIMEERKQVKDWIKTFLCLSLGCVGLFSVLFICQRFIEPVSRRTANLPFCIWILAQSLFFLCCLICMDLILVFAKLISRCSHVPCSWTVGSIPSRKNRISSSSSDKATLDKERCLLQSINRNQLFYFLLSNFMTGLTNLTIDTLSQGALVSICVLMVYMFINCFTLYVLHLQEVSVKFW
ncbi:phosphatidylinositol-glycan biosynthesis class W protein [Polypterus senegalus]